MRYHKFQKRFYRDLVKTEELYHFNLIEKETDLLISTDVQPDTSFIKERIISYRNQIEIYITRDPRFLSSLKPIPVELSAPPIVKKMAEASKKADVGPMASVAGAIADFLGMDLLKAGCKQVIIENGGDIFIKTTKERRVAFYTGKRKSWKGLTIKIKPQDSPVGICTSSGTVGHSLSFGLADCVTILAKNATLADAVATACGNRIKSEKDLNLAVQYAKSISGVKGVVFIMGKHLATWGKIEISP